MAYNGTYTGGPTLTAGQSGFGNALLLNGTTQYVDLGTSGPLSFSANSAWTIELWLKTTSSSGVFVAVGAHYSDNNGLWIGLNAGKLACSPKDAVASVTASAGGVGGDGHVNNGAWHHIAVVNAGAGGAVTGYIDGVQAFTQTQTFSQGTIDGQGIGAFVHGGSTGNFFPGTIDEVAVSTVAHYTTGFVAPSAPFLAARSGQRALYHLDESTGATTALDAVTPAIAATPSSMTAGVAQSVALVGTGTVWTTGGGGTTFSLAGGTGASITAQSVTDATHASVSVTPGTAAGTLTLTDSTDAGSVTITVAANPVTLAVTDANWFFSPATWYLAGSTYAQTACPGAYFKVNFTGTSATLALDTTPLSGASVSAGLYPKIRYSLDNGPFTDVQLASGQNVTFAASASLAAGTHTLECYLLATDNTVDAWTTPAGVWRITGLQVDSGAASVAPTLLSKRALFFGDSITEGAAALAVGSVIASNDSTLTIARLAASALGAEYGLIAFQQQGYSAATATGRHVPALYTAGNEASTAWNKHFSGQSRLVAGLLSPAPDYIVCLQGVNDAGLAGATVQAAVQAWLGAVRTAAPLAWLVVVIPFGGFTRTRITAGYNAYVAATGDSRAVLLDFGDQTGLTVSTGVANRVSFDGVHPRTTYHAVLGAMLAQAIQRTTAAAAPQPLALRRRLG